MSFRASLIFAILFSSVAFAAQSPLQKFLNSSFEPDQSPILQNLSAPGNLVLISIGANETYVVDAVTGKPLSDKAEIEAALSSDFRAKNGVDAKVATALALATDVSSAKQKDEAQCMLLTGTDAHPCADIEQCKVACLSNPNCASSVYFSDGFIEALLDWSISRTSFDSKLSAYSSGIDAIKNDSSAIDSKAALLSELSALSFRMSNSTIFLNRTDEQCKAKGARCYEYCKKIDYSKARLDSERQNLLNLKSLISSLQQQGARTATILSAGATNSMYISTRGGDYQQFRVKMQNEIKKLSQNASDFAKKVSDPQMNAALSEISALSAQVVQLGDQGLYRQALALQPQYDSKQKAASDRMASGLSSYKELADAIESLSDKVDKSRGIIGATSAAGYLSQIAAINTSLASPLPLQDISAKKSEVSAIKDKLTVEIADKATSGSQPPSGSQAQIPVQMPAQIPTEVPKGIPCMPSLVALAAMGFAFARKN